MRAEKQRTEGMQKVADMVENIKIGMLTTTEMNGQFSSRPMYALEIDAQGSIWFFTNAHSAKTHHLDRVGLTFVDKGNSDYLSIFGSADLVNDPVKIDALWGPATEPWFRGGKDDPEVALLRVTVESAEIWDATDSTMVRLIAMAAAAVTGEPNAVLKGDHEHISNPSRPSYN